MYNTPTLWRGCKPIFFQQYFRKPYKTEKSYGAQGGQGPQSASEMYLDARSGHLSFGRNVTDEFLKSITFIILEFLNKCYVSLVFTCKESNYILMYDDNY